MDTGNNGVDTGTARYDGALDTSKFHSFQYKFWYLEKKRWNYLTI